MVSLCIQAEFIQAIETNPIDLNRPTLTSSYQDFRRTVHFNINVSD